MFADSTKIPLVLHHFYYAKQAIYMHENSDAKCESAGWLPNAYAECVSVGKSIKAAAAKSH